MSAAAKEAYKNKLAQEAAEDAEAKKLIAELGLEDEVAKDPVLEAKLKAKDEQEAKEAAQKVALAEILKEQQVKEALAIKSTPDAPVPSGPKKYAPPGSEIKSDVQPAVARKYSPPSSTGPASTVTSATTITAQEPLEVKDAPLTGPAEPSAPSTHKYGPPPSKTAATTTTSSETTPKKYAPPPPKQA
jgi:hypothetical protein